MKGKLITNGVLSLLLVIMSLNDFLGFVFWSLEIASLVMGIVTLVTMGENKSGLVIASGVLGIFFGVFGVNAIVSFFAASKVS